MPNELRDKLQKNAKRPPYDADPPLDVKSFDVDLYLYMSWRDPSLNHTEPEYVLINDPKVRDQLWLPDLYFANARTAFFHHTYKTEIFSRVTLTVACNLQLANYPIDHQACNIRILSYAYIANQVNVTWFKRGAVRHNSEIGLPEFSINNVTAEYCDGTYVYAITEHSYKKDQFSCLEGKLFLRRSIGYHLVQSYIPTGLIVIISWVSFWIDRRAVPARVTLSFTTLLSLSTLGNGLRFGLPQVSYAKAIDYWFGACMIFVFLALLEFAVVNSYMRRASKYEKLSKCVGKKASKISDTDDEGPFFPPLAKNSTIVFNVSESKDITEKQNGGSHFENRKISKSSYSIRVAQQHENNESFNDLAPKLDLPIDNDIHCMHGPTNRCASCMVDSIRLIDESPTKTTFLTDEELEPTTKYLAPPPIRFHNPRRRMTRQGPREPAPIGINHFLQLASMKEFRPAIIRMHERGVEKHEIGRLLGIQATNLWFLIDLKVPLARLGWMYEFAMADDQKYKESNVILEKALIRESRGIRDPVSSNTRNSSPSTNSTQSDDDKDISV
uniref:Uncharacterized protein n=1 Tax=Acrobeloides nanus TaxID=290746 RepID=A0A914EM38_9BILA